jgi:predicted GNAT family N-acyltransferase
MKIEFLADDQLSEVQKEKIRQLRTAVYPTAVLATTISKQFLLASSQWSVWVWDEGELVSRVGLLTREIISNGETKTIGGIGGVLTHPDSQNKGHATEAMREAARILNEEWKISFGLLFCASRVVEFYKRLDWKPFQGNIYVEQRKGRVEFTGNNPMVLDVREHAPAEGSLDLNGYPW